MKALAYAALATLLVWAGFRYLSKAPGVASDTLLAVLGVCIAVVAMCVFMMRLVERTNAEQVTELKEGAVSDAQLYERVVQSAGAEHIRVGSSSLNAEVSGLYRGFRFSLVTAGVGDDNGTFAMIWFSGNAPENWPERLPRSRSAQRALSPAAREAWGELKRLGEVFPDGPRSLRGKLAFAPKSERWGAGHIPQDPAIYSAALAALALVARELDQGHSST